MIVCAYCEEQIQLITDDYLDWCENCHLVESDTIELSDDENDTENNGGCNHEDRRH